MTHIVGDCRPTRAQESGSPLAMFFRSLAPNFNPQVNIVVQVFTELRRSFCSLSSLLSCSTVGDRAFASAGLGLRNSLALHAADLLYYRFLL